MYKKTSAVVDYLNYHYPEIKLVMLKYFRPAIIGRPAGPVRSDLFGPAPVPVIKNSDRFHLWVIFWYYYPRHRRRLLTSTMNMVNNLNEEFELIQHREVYGSILSAPESTIIEAPLAKPQDFNL